MKTILALNGVRLRLSVRCRGRARESSSVFPALLQPDFTPLILALIFPLLAGGFCLADDAGAAAEMPPGTHHETITLREPIGLAWGPELVQVQVGFGKPCHISTLSLRNWAGKPVPFQVVEPEYYKKRLARCRIAFMASLAPMQQIELKLYYSERPPEIIAPPEPARQGNAPAPQDEVAPDENTAPPGDARQSDVSSPASLIRQKSLQWSVLSAGAISVRFLSSSCTLSEPIPATVAPPPIAAIRGPDGVWRGKGELRSPFQVRRWASEIIADGPLFAAVRIRYELDGGRHYQVVVSAGAGAGCVRFAEEFSIGDNSCFLLRNPNKPSDEIGRPMMRRSADVISRLTPHAQENTTLAGRPAARYMSVAAPGGNDMFVLFSIKPGEWRNPIGSAINLITIKNDLSFHFPLDDGTRCTGFYATTLAKGTSDEICRAIARASDAPLQDVLEMQLTDGRLELIKQQPEDHFELAEIAEAVAEATQAVVRGGFNGSACQKLDPSEIGLAARVFRRLKAAGEADTPTGRLLARRLAFLGNTFFDRSFYGCHILLDADLPPGGDYDRSSIDWLRNVERFTALAEIAQAVPDYRSANDWLDHAERQLALTLKHLLTPWGMWKQGDAAHARAVQLLRRTSNALAATGRNHHADDQAFTLMLRYQPIVE